MSYQRILASLICGLSTTTAFSCEKNQALVTESNSPKYAVNTCVTTNPSSPLKEGEQLVLQNSKKEKEKMTGYSAVETLAKLIKEFVKVSGPRASSQKIDLWAIDVTADNAFCFKPAQELFLQRVEARHSETVIFTTTDQEEKSVTYLWPAGQTRLSWPKELPVTDKVAYFVEIKGQATRELTFYQVPGDKIGDELAGWMVDQGCIRQKRNFLGVP